MSDYSNFGIGKTGIACLILGGLSLMLGFSLLAAEIYGFNSFSWHELIYSTSLATKISFPMCFVFFGIGGISEIKRFKRTFGGRRRTNSYILNEW